MNGEAKRTRLDQRRAPIHEALENFRRMRVVPFDVPGHKRGRGNPELTAFLGQQCVGVDVNSMKPLDNLCHPVSVIREAEELAADAFGAAHAFLMVGGTTSSVQSMVPVSYTHLSEQITFCSATIKPRPEKAGAFLVLGVRNMSSCFSWETGCSRP